MKTYKAKVGANWGFVGSERDDEIVFDMPDDATPDQVQEEAYKLAFDWACEYLDCWADKPELEDGKDG